MSLFMMWKNQQVSNSGSRENNKAPSFFLGALNLFNLRREQNLLFFTSLPFITYWKPTTYSGFTA